MVLQEKAYSTHPGPEVSSLNLIDLTRNLQVINHLSRLAAY